MVGAQFRRNDERNLEQANLSERVVGYFGCQMLSKCGYDMRWSCGLVTWSQSSHKGVSKHCFHTCVTRHGDTRLRIECKKTSDHRNNVGHEPPQSTPDVTLLRHQFIRLVDRAADMDTGARNRKEKREARRDTHKQQHRHRATKTRAQWRGMSSPQTMWDIFVFQQKQTLSCHIALDMLCQEMHEA